MRTSAKERREALKKPRKSELLGWHFIRDGRVVATSNRTKKPNRIPPYGVSPWAQEVGNWQPIYYMEVNI